MKRLPPEIIHFFKAQGFVIVSTVDKRGWPHNSCKGIIEIKGNGQISLLDLYWGQTFLNLKNNPHISITAVDEHKFKGYCLKGKAKIVKQPKLKTHTLASWDEKITSRLTKRLIRNIKEEKGQQHHPEALLPAPAYMIVAKIYKVIDLTPQHITRFRKEE